MSFMMITPTAALEMLDRKKQVDEKILLVLAHIACGRIFNQHSVMIRADIDDKWDFLNMAYKDYNFPIKWIRVASRFPAHQKQVDDNFLAKVINNEVDAHLAITQFLNNSLVLYMNSLTN